MTVPLPPRPRGAASPIDETPRPALGSGPNAAATQLAAPFDVGSLPRPDHLLDARDKKAKGGIGAAELRRIEDEAIARVAKEQENLGLRGITDGEYRRFLWHLDFLSQFDNVTEKPGRFLLGVDKTEDISKGFRPNCMAVTGKFKRSHPIQLEDFKYLKSATKETAKVCVPSPTLMHFRGGREAIDKEAYPTMAAFYKDLADAYNQEFQDLARAGSWNSRSTTPISPISAT